MIVLLTTILPYIFTTGRFVSGLESNYRCVSKTQDCLWRNIDVSLSGIDSYWLNSLKRPNPAVRSLILKSTSTYSNSDLLSSVWQYNPCEVAISVKILKNYNSYRLETLADYSFLFAHKNDDRNSTLHFKELAGSRTEDDFSKKQVKNFFKRYNGEIIQVHVGCVSYSVGISSFNIPSLTPEFIEGAKLLHVASGDPDNTTSINTFRNFVTTFGTHYSKRVHYGSKMVYQKYFKHKSANADHEDKRKDCLVNSVKDFIMNGFENVVTGEARLQGLINICSDSGVDYSYNNYDTITTFGPIPTTGLEDWIKNTSTKAVPVAFELDKISNLFQNNWNWMSIHVRMPRDTERLNATAVYNFLEDMSGKYCNTLFGEECKIISRGCGINSDCNINTHCVEDDSAEGYSCVGDSGELTTNICAYLYVYNICMLLDFCKYIPN